MKSKSLLRLEWISLVYLALFVFAVLSPSLIGKGYLGIDEKHIEEFLIFIFGIVGLGTFSFYERVMETKDREHEDAKNEYDRAKKELVESYKYIGSINRKMEVLKGIANKTSIKVGESQRMTRELLSTLLVNAAQCVGAPRALLRYVFLEKARTEHETTFGDDVEPLRISNRQLVTLHDDGVSHALIQSEDGKEVLVVLSDHKGKSVKAYLLLETNQVNGLEADTSLLKVFANQAGLLYYTQAEASKKETGILDLIEEAKKSVVGEVG